MIRPGPPTVVALRALGLGDLLTAVPALRAVRTAYPLHRLVLAAPRRFAELLPAIEAVDEVLDTAGPTRPPWDTEPPDVAVNLHGRGPQSVSALLALRPKRLLSHACPDYPEVQGPRWRTDTHEVRRWCHMLRWYGMVADPRDLRLHRPPGPRPVPGAVLVHPGAAHGARRWPATRFAAVARELAADGHRVLITGGRQEHGLATAVAQGAGLPDDAVQAGCLGLRELAATVAEARLVVCGDTGVGHLAAGYERPSIHLFGPVPPSEWGPPPHPRHRVLWAGRTGSPFAERTDPGLLEIGAAEVLATAHELISAAPV